VGGVLHCAAFRDQAGAASRRITSAVVVHLTT
jgi:hypothetical protein